MSIYGVNGILTPMGKNKTTDKLLSRLHKYSSTVDVDYPLIGVLLSYSMFLEKKHARTLLKSIEGDPQPSVIAHSRGALVVQRAIEMGAKFKNIYLFNAAMRNSYRFPSECAQNVYNIYNPKDVALLTASFLPFSRMGAYGKWPHQETINFNQLLFNQKHTVLGHSEAFLDENIDGWAEFIVNAETLS